MVGPAAGGRTIIFGAGRAGVALAAAMTVAGLDVAVVSRSEAGAARARSRGVRIVTGTERADCWILAVPDDAIGDCATALLTERRDTLPRIALHLSGVASPAAVAPLAAHGVEVGSLHPLQTLTHASGSEALQGAPAAIGGSEVAAAEATALARALGMRPFALADGSRALYHAAGAMAANFTVALLDRAIATAVRAGMPPELAREGLARLAAAAASRVEAEGPEAALTGPIRRGDAGTINRHLAALESAAPVTADDSTLYRALAEPTLALAARAGLDAARVVALRETLARDTR